MTTPIPHAALLQHIIALGKTGSGKSSKLRVLVEELLDLERPVCIIDPKGDWWGLKSSADGKTKGYPLIIFGGEHADVPINEHSGAHVAELVATGNRSALIDLGGWMIGERTRFFIEFASHYFKLIRGARTLVLPEVHNFAPKGKIMDPAAGKMLHWANRLASEGRGKGLTILADSQRPQKVHNDFLTSCETLIACRVIHKADRDAIKDWVDGCADANAGKQLLAELAQMKRTDAWCWSPENNFGPERITWPMFKTFDSFKPQPERAAKMVGWASVDLDEVKAKLATVVEEAKANDPKALRARIAELDKQVRDLKAAPAQTFDPQALEDAEERGHEHGWSKGYARATEAANRAYSEAAQVMADKFADIMQLAARVAGTEKINGARAENPTRSGTHPVRSAPSPARPAPRARQIDARAPSNGLDLSGAERKVLTVLAQHGDCTAGKLALLSGYTYSGGFRNTLSALRGKGLIEGENTGTMAITNAGFNCGPFDELPTGPALRDHWLGHSQFGSAERKVLEVLFENPDGLDGQALATRAGYEYSGGFRNTLSKLRTAGVLVGKNTGVMTATQELLG